MPRIDEQDAQDFLSELMMICIKHQLSISHEDGHGAFLIVPYDKHYETWLLQARIEDEETHHA